MGNETLFRKVRGMKLPRGRYVLFGSTPLGIRGLKNCRDVDVLLVEDLWEEYRKKNWEVVTLSHGSECLRNGDVELWKDWKPGQWNVDQLIEEAEIIDGLPFVKLESVLEWKKLSGREKDLKDIETIEKFFESSFAHTGQK